MKILNKNGLNFAVGMFWQVPDYAKKTVNLSKIYKETSNDMFCTVQNHNSLKGSIFSNGLKVAENNKTTYGFCNKKSLQNAKNVASLGKYIINAARLTSDYPDSIICFKFKNAGDQAEDGQLLKEDLYGYLVLLNGTICPIEGEYVGEFELVKNSVIEKAKLHEIDTLYLPLDVSDKFLNIFERLEFAYHMEYAETLIPAILKHANLNSIEVLLKFINDNIKGVTLESLSNYLLDRINNQLNTSNENEIIFADIKALVTHETFKYKIKENIQLDSNVRYLVQNVLQVPVTSEDIFWNSKLKQNHSKCLLKTFTSQAAKLYKSIGICVLIGVIGYILYWYLNPNKDDNHLAKTVIMKREKPKAVLMNPSKLIEICLGNGNDKFFKDLGGWKLISLNCDSLGFNYTFKNSNQNSFNKADGFSGESSLVKIDSNNAVYTKKFSKIIGNQLNKSTLDKDFINQLLSQKAEELGFSFKVNKNLSAKSKGNFFDISSNLSPVFLLNKGVFENLNLQSIDMKINNNTGTYSWTIKGEY